MKRTNDELRSMIRGPYPGTGEVAVYYLRNTETNTVFYAGATGNPRARLATHIHKYGDDITMSIVKIVPDYMSNIEEASLIIQLNSQGIHLINQAAGGVRANTGQVCAAYECDRRAEVKGHCRTHYGRITRNGAANIVNKAGRKKSNTSE